MEINKDNEIPRLIEIIFNKIQNNDVIDTFNKKPVPWLYPIRKKGFCFNVCYASKIGNSILMWAGFGACLALLIWRIMIILGKV